MTIERLLQLCIWHYINIISVILSNIKLQHLHYLSANFSNHY